VSLRDVLFVSEDFYVSSYEAVYDAFAAVDVGGFHDDGVLYFVVSYGCVVFDASVGSDVGVGANLTVVAYDGWFSEGYVAVDNSASPYCDVVRYFGSLELSSRHCGIRFLCNS